MNADKSPLTLNGVIEPEHLLQAIQNSLEHSDETAHGVTGICFEKYTLTVRKLKGLNWHIQCKFRPSDRKIPTQAHLDVGG
jgi:hypothetical protein